MRHEYNCIYTRYREGGTPPKKMFPIFDPRFDPRWASKFNVLVDFGPFQAVSRPDSDSGRSALHFGPVKPQKLAQNTNFPIF